MSLFYQARDFLVNFRRCLRTYRSAAIGFRFERDVAKGAHTEFTDHTVGYIGDVLDVLASTSRDIAKNKLFGGASAHCTRHFCEQFRTAHEIAVLSWGLDGDTKGHTPGNSLHLAHRVRTGHRAHDDSMPNFMIGNDRFLRLCNKAAFALRPCHNAQDGFLKFRHGGDARCMFFSFFKEVPYARGAYTEKHLNKFRATHAKECDSSFTCYGS